MAKNVKDLITDINFIFKLVELALAITGMAIMCDRGTSGAAYRLGDVVLLNLAFSAYVIIIAGIIVIIIFDDASTFMVVLYLITGGILNLAAGIVAIINYSNLVRGGGTAFMLSLFAFINGVVMLIDAVFEFRQ